MAFDKQERMSIAVYLYYNRDARKLSQYGDIIYHSRKLRYLLLYVNQEKLDALLLTLQKQKFVKEVVPSYRKELDTNFVGSLWRSDEEE